MMNWIDVRNRLPKDKQVVIGYFPHDEGRPVWIFQWSLAYTKLGDMSPTHWMPLPEPPEE